RDRATVKVADRGRPLTFQNTNGLVRAHHWDVGLSKTGYISEARRWLVMRVKLASKDLIVVLLDSWGKQCRIGDANRIKKWVEHQAADGRASYSPASARTSSRALRDRKSPASRRRAWGVLRARKRRCRPSISTTPPAASSSSASAGSASTTRRESSSPSRGAIWRTSRASRATVALCSSTAAARA